MGNAANFLCPDTDPQPDEGPADDNNFKRNDKGDEGDNSKGGDRKGDNRSNINSNTLSDIGMAKSNPDRGHNASQQRESCIEKDFPTPMSPNSESWRAFSEKSQEGSNQDCNSLTDPLDNLTTNGCMSPDKQPPNPEIPPAAPTKRAFHLLRTPMKEDSEKATQTPPTASTVHSHDETPTSRKGMMSPSPISTTPPMKTYKLWDLQGTDLVNQAPTQLHQCLQTNHGRTPTLVRQYKSLCKA